MDISSLAISMSHQQVNNDIQVAVLSKSLDTFEDMGADLKKMLEASVTPHLGQNIDYLV